jgi:hypothetical protein
MESWPFAGNLEESFPKSVISPGTARAKLPELQSIWIETWSVSEAVSRRDVRVCGSFFLNEVVFYMISILCAAVAIGLLA